MSVLKLFSKTEGGYVARLASGFLGRWLFRVVSLIALVLVILLIWWIFVRSMQKPLYLSSWDGHMEADLAYTLDGTSYQLRYFPLGLSGRHVGRFWFLRETQEVYELSPYEDETYVYVLKSLDTPAELYLFQLESGLYITSDLAYFDRGESWVFVGDLRRRAAALHLEGLNHELIFARKEAWVQGLQSSLP